jgi:hypothetical protein
MAKKYIKKKKNMFIILPGYKRKLNLELSDIQLSVTGSTKFIY